jgi:hypothetical protein
MPRYAAANPVRDFRDAVGRGDHYFVGLYGFALEVPGVDDYHERYADRVPVRMIEGTSDAIKSAEFGRLNDACREYAYEFNRRMRRHVDRR